MLKPLFRMLALAGLILSPGLAKGSILTAAEAKDVATGFFRNVSDAHAGNSDVLTLTYIEKTDSTPRYYIFNATDNKGFVIVSADDSALPVMAYSTTSAWLPQAMPEAAERLLDNTVAAPSSSRMRSPSRAASGKKLLSTPSWSQEAPFNSMIPNRPLVGCVGTALAEILKYHQYPSTRHATLVKDGESTTYDWANMRNDNYRSGYSASEGDAVGTLVADAAVAIGTDFGMASSSAFEVKVPSALVSMFGYDAGVSYKKGSEMDRESWDALIVNEIDENRPVLYSGQDVSAGHAFVCDGYEIMGSTVYLHINWGWGGAADGFFASDALNPTVSKTYNFNNLTTIIYNIKPAASAAEWSPIHLTSDEKQVGLTLDISDIAPGATFTARIGALKNITNDDFAGYVSLALFTTDGTFKQLLGEGKRFSLPSLQVLKYTDMSCTVAADTDIADSDVVRVVTRDNASTAWLPVANDLLTIGEVCAKGNNIPYFNIDIPTAVDGVEITCAESRVIKGRDFSFKVVPATSENVVTVKANGFILTPNNHTYTLSNVTSDQTITVIVQNIADVVSRRTLWVQAGKLQELIGETEAGTITDLTLYGTIDATDFTFMRDRMKLSSLDISGVSIVANGANPANAIPANAFKKYSSLSRIVLPKNVNAFKSGCFSYSGLTSIEIPASVSTYEYNIFLGCSRLSEVTVRRAAVAWVNWCVFEGTPKAKLIVPVGTASAYQGKEYWQDFKEIIEQNPEPASAYTVSVQEIHGVRFTPMAEVTEVAPGSQYEFKVETDDSFGDATIEIYANNTRLYAGEDGLFRTPVNNNTFIHVNIREPEATWADSPWKITGAAGGVGLVTDVVNVVAGKAFTIRANALSIPSQNADQYYCAALTDKDGNVKELISPVVWNSVYNFGNQPCNFTCQVKNASIREGNHIRIVSSLDKKKWSLVNADCDSVTDRISAIGNRVVYYNVNMPQKVEGAVIQGGATQVVKGMPFTLKVTPVSVDDRITLAVNGINKVVDAAVANLSIPAVVEDLEISIQVNPQGSNSYTVVNVREGELDAKIAQCPTRLKVIGVMRSEDFDAFRKHAATIVDLDLADVTIKGALDLANAIPTNAFASTAPVQTALKTIILPTNLINIEENAFYRCVNLAEVTLPETVRYVGAGAFSSCVGLKKIIVKGNQPPSTGNMTPFPANTSNINLEVPAGAESLYSSANFWNELGQSTSKVFYNIQIDPERSFNYNEFYQLTKIDVSNGKTQVTVGLPNCKPTSYKSNPTYRPGVAFKLYDNDRDVTTTSSYVCYGQHSVILDPSYQEGSIRFPQNHEIKVVFHYPIEIHCPEGLKTELVNLNESDIWRSADMSLFVEGSTAYSNLFKEGEDYKFRILSDVSNIEPTVRCVSHVVTSFGDNPQFSDIETILTPDENGLYTISNLQGSVNIEISASVAVEDGEQLSSTALSLISEESAKEITDIAIEGELDSEAFTEIREKFTSLKALDLSDMKNEKIPAQAFLGMDNLVSVVIPENVISIGDGAFKDCRNLESITLPGVDAIGDNAFNGCSSLTSITLLGKSTPESGENPASRSNAPGKARLTQKAFNGLNPNCLIYTTGSLDMDLSDMPNVIVNEGNTRVASSDIVLVDGYPFNAPASFNLGSHSISMTIDIPGSISDDNDGWRGIVLPFTPESLIFGSESFTPRGEVMSLLSLDENEDTFTKAGGIKANRPYLVNIHAPFATVPVTFTATARQNTPESPFDVVLSPLAEELSISGSRFTLCGTYTPTDDTTDAYILDENGSSFVRGSADTQNLAPFSVYLRSADTETVATLPVGTHPIWVFNPDAVGNNGFRLYRSQKIELASRTEGSTIYYTTDGSNPAESETRKVYDGPFGLESESLSINAIAEYKGNLSQPVGMTYNLRTTNVSYNLADGWNWISHNVENDMPVESIISDKVQRVLSQTQEIIRDPQLGLVGTLSTLHPLEAYKVFTSGSDNTRQVNGVSFDPHQTMTLGQGWNWIGCPVEESELSLADIFANLNAEEGDMIVGREGFAQADGDGNWIGDLQSLTLGRGYMFRSVGAKDFIYNTVPSQTETRKSIVRRNQKATWTVESARYPSVMPVISRIVKGGNIPAEAGEFEIGAFCGNECRGIGVCVDGWTMINVFGNSGDKISFRALSAETHSEHTLGETLEFSEEPVGSLSKPFVMNATSTSGIESVIGGETKVIVENGTIKVTGDTASVKSVEIYDTAGHREAISTEDAKLKFDSLKAGVHIVVVHTTEGRTSHKVEIL